MRFLFTALPTNDLGLLARSLPIAWELAERGHHIYFSNPALSPRRVIEDAGFENVLPKHPLYELGFTRFGYHALTRMMRSGIMNKDYGNVFRFFYILIRSLPTKFAPVTDEVWDLDHAAAIEGMMNSNFIKSQCNAYIEVIKESRAEIVVDFWNPFSIIAARRLGKPLITINQADALPGGRGFIWWKEKPEGVPSAVPAMNKVLRAFDLPRIRKLEELNLGDLTLLSGMPETDPIAEVPYDYTGAAIWQQEDSALPEWFEQLSKDRPVVWLYPGNPVYWFKGHIFDSRVILEATIDLLGNRELQVVLAMGYHEIPEDLLPLPDNFIHVRYVPGLSMAERADIMVHHGGYGSCQTALYTGTPALIIPTFSERESNARRMAALGAAEFVSVVRDDQGRKTVHPGDLAAKFDKVLTDASYKINAARYGKKLRNTGNPGSTADMIERFLQDFPGSNAMSTDH